MPVPLTLQFIQYQTYQASHPESWSMRAHQWPCLCAVLRVACFPAGSGPSRHPNRGIRLMMPYAISNGCYPPKALPSSGGSGPTTRSTWLLSTAFTRRWAQPRISGSPEAFGVPT